MGLGWLGAAAGAINPVAAIGTIAGGAGQLIGDYMQSSATQQAQHDANATNMELQARANAFNHDEAQLNRDYQTQMSNSAWQRGVADMKAAGVNPMLAISQGGASSPSGATASGSAAHVSPEMDTRGASVFKSLGSMGSSAVNLAQVSKELESKDAQIAGTKAAATASLAAAANSQASAKATETRMPEFAEGARSAHERADAEIADAQARRARAGYDRDYAGVDKAIDVTAKALTLPSSALNIKRIWESIKSPSQRNHEFLDKQGSKGVRVK